MKTYYASLGWNFGLLFTVNPKKQYSLKTATKSYFWHMESDRKCLNRTSIDINSKFYSRKDSVILGNFTA